LLTKQLFKADFKKDILEISDLGSLNASKLYQSQQRGKTASRKVQFPLCHHNTRINWKKSCKPLLQWRVEAMEYLPLL